ncbi:MAG: DUF885 family protein, partial [Novosphingobium sp.]
MGLKFARLAIVTGVMAVIAAGQAGAAEPTIALSPATQKSEDQRLMELFAQDSKAELALNPLESVYRGSAVNTEVLAKLFTADLDRQKAAATRRSLAALVKISRAKLSPERQISYDVFAGDKREELAFLQPDVLALTAVQPLSHFGGLHVEFPSIIAAGGSLPYKSEADYLSALAILRTIPAVLDNAGLRFREGMASGVVATKLTTVNMVGQIDALLGQKLDESPFTSPLRQFPDGVSAAARPQIAAAWNAAVRDEVYPAYRRLRQELNTDYLPVAREQVGLSAMKGGPGLYR